MAAVEDLLAAMLRAAPPDPSRRKEDHAARAAWNILVTAHAASVAYPSPVFREEMGGVASLVGRLVDLAANLIQLTFELPRIKQRRISAAWPRPPQVFAAIS